MRANNMKRAASAVGEGSSGVAFVHQVLHGWEARCRKAAAACSIAWVCHKLPSLGVS